MRPRIAITGVLTETKFSFATQISQAYTEGVIQAGGTPVLLPLTSAEVDEQWLAGINGLLLSGGEDVDPVHYGENPHVKQGRISPERDMQELKLIAIAEQKKLPILAICRGLQILNIAHGGTLYQDIYSQMHGVMKHSQNAPRWYGTHRITLDRHSRLCEIFGKQNIHVNSYHHQAVDTIAEGFKAVAWADDGVVEAIEKIGEPFAVAVQWHPEEMWKTDALQMALFRKFVEACR